jgi:hypothetical protein
MSRSPTGHEFWMPASMGGNECRAPVATALRPQCGKLPACLARNFRQKFVTWRHGRRSPEATLWMTSEKLSPGLLRYFSLLTIECSSQMKRLPLSSGSGIVTSSVFTARYLRHGQTRIQ